MLLPELIGRLDRSGEECKAPSPAAGASSAIIGHNLMKSRGGGGRDVIDGRRGVNPLF